MQHVGKPVIKKAKHLYRGDAFLLDNDRAVVRLINRCATFIKFSLAVDGKATRIFYADPEAEFRMIDVERVGKCGENVV